MSTKQNQQRYLKGLKMVVPEVHYIDRQNQFKKSKKQFESQKENRALSIVLVLQKDVLKLIISVK